MGILQEAADVVLASPEVDLDALSVERVVVGLFFTGVKLSNGSGGVCYTPVKDIPEAVCCPTSAGRSFDPTRVRGTPVPPMLDFLGSREPIKAAVAIATLNACTAAARESGGAGDYDLRLHEDAQDAVDLSDGRRVALVGAFTPTLRALRARGGPWWVIEQDPRTLKGEELAHYVPASDAKSILAEADTVIVTGVTLVNHTLEGILEAVRPRAEVAVVGPTASMAPEPLFSRGVKVVGGVWVRRTDDLLDVLAAGGSGYHFFDSLADRTVLTPRGSQQRERMGKAAV